MPEPSEVVAGTQLNWPLGTQRKHAHDSRAGFLAYGLAPTIVSEFGFVSTSSSSASLIACDEDAAGTVYTPTGCVASDVMLSTLSTL
jgi:hypothetical protein